MSESPIPFTPAKAKKAPEPAAPLPARVAIRVLRDGLCLTGPPSDLGVTDERREGGNNSGNVMDIQGVHGLVVKLRAGTVATALRAEADTAVANGTAAAV